MRPQLQEAHVVDAALLRCVPRHYERAVEVEEDRPDEQHLAAVRLPHRADVREEAVRVLGGVLPEIRKHACHVGVADAAQFGEQHRGVLVDTQALHCLIQLFEACADGLRVLHGAHRALEALPCARLKALWQLWRLCRPAAGLWG